MLKPDQLEPEITGLEFFLDAFRELSTSRQSGFSIGAIPFTAIVEYFSIYEIDGDFDEFIYVIRRMDSVFLELNAEDMKKKPQGDKGKKSVNTDSNKKNHN